MWSRILKCFVITSYLLEWPSLKIQEILTPLVVR